MEIGSIQTSTINQADNYFAYPATIKHGRESLLRGYACVWYIVRMLAGLLPQTGSQLRGDLCVQGKLKSVR